MIFFLSQQILIFDELEPSKPTNKRLRENLNDRSSFIRVLREIGARQIIMDHMSEWEALRSFETWALYEEAHERQMTPEEQAAFHALSPHAPEDDKAWDEMSWEDWVKLWAHWQQLHYQYLHLVNPKDIITGGAPERNRFNFELCECQRLPWRNENQANQLSLQVKTPDASLSAAMIQSRASYTTM